MSKSTKVVVRVVEQAEPKPIRVLVKVVESPKVTSKRSK